MEVADFFVIAMFLTFIGLLIVGVPVMFSLAGTAVIFTGVGYLGDIYLNTATGLDYNYFGIIVNRIYKMMTNWVLVAAPMFIFMGLMMDRSGIAEKLMRSTQDLFGKVRGGLAITVMVIGVLLAASTGIIGASVVLLGVISLPTMMKQGYSKELATGTIASAGTLGILIPPSIMLVFMADRLGISAGDLFLGAVFPGVVLSLLYICYLLVFCYIKPTAAPLSPNRRPISWKTISAVFKDVIPPAILIVAVLGSIFAGIATVTEASGVGALGATLLALVNRKLDLKILKDSLLHTFNTIGYIFGILIGATCFALVLRGLGGDEFIEGLLTGLPFGAYGVIFFILFIIFFLGFFLDWIEITLIILPLLAPVIPKLGLPIEGYGIVENPDLIWFSILVAVTLQTSFLTPPVGFALFYLKGVCPVEIQLVHLYRGIIPFVILQITGIIIIFFWPTLVTWLPALAYGG